MRPGPFCTLGSSGRPRPLSCLVCICIFALRGGCCLRVGASESFDAFSFSFLRFAAVSFAPASCAAAVCSPTFGQLLAPLAFPPFVLLSLFSPSSSLVSPCPVWGWLACLPRNGFILLTCTIEDCAQFLPAGLTKYVTGPRRWITVKGSHCFWNLRLTADKEERGNQTRTWSFALKSRNNVFSLNFSAILSDASCALFVAILKDVFSLETA